MKTKNRLTKTQAFILSIFLISVFMTAVMSFGMLAVRNGITYGIFKRWVQDFLLGCAIAVPAGYVIVPSIQKLMDKLS
ncbi:DUF2798 domain-containing protein [uncultured Mucilaginibacter sp.]|uniref:DUF2798 domain-containing protein n=1 Tax=uncultured Mucilaginibacter sp. TaxID=797541 RepID=UPI002630FE7C|nr:DUF2798 domain-containing protein [uncultured Mucilaginibacter sp.]